MDPVKSFIATALLGALQISLAWASDCALPIAPREIPDGAVATRAQMLASAKIVQAYNDATIEYLRCIRSEHEAALKAAGDKVTDEEKARLQQVETEEHNGALDDLQRVGDHYNEQVNAYNQQLHARKHEP